MLNLVYNYNYKILILNGLYIELLSFDGQRNFFYPIRAHTYTKSQFPKNRLVSMNFQIFF